jgi:hypothetical protein
LRTLKRVLYDDDGASKFTFSTPFKGFAVVQVDWNVREMGKSVGIFVVINIYLIYLWEIRLQANCKTFNQRKKCHEDNLISINKKKNKKYSILFQVGKGSKFNI